MYFFCTQIIKSLKTLSMKKIILGLVCVLTLSAVNAQKGTTQIGVAAELGLPMGDFGDGFKTGFGGSVKGLFGIGEAGQITFTTGYSGFKMKGSTDDFKMSLSIIPLLAGYRHNFSGFYVEPQLGYGIYGVKTEFDDEDATDSEGAFTYALGLGYAKNGFDAGVRYQNGKVKDADSGFSLIAFRVGYNFTLGGGSASK
jgi:hypothetical protein